MNINYYILQPIVNERICAIISDVYKFISLLDEETNERFEIKIIDINNKYFKNLIDNSEYVKIIKFENKVEIVEILHPKSHNFHLKITIKYLVII